MEEPYLSKRGNTWYLCWRVDGQNYPCRNSLSTTEEKKAKEALCLAKLAWLRSDSPEAGILALIAEKTGKKAKPKPHSNPSSRITLAQLTAEWLTEAQSKAQRTRQYYRMHANRFNEYFGEETPIDLITPAEILDYRNKRAGEVHKISVNKELVSLGTLFGLAVKRGYLRGNPASSVDRFSIHPSDREGLREPELIAEGTYRAMLSSKACRENPPLRLVLPLLWHTGMRIGEVLRVRWKDVDLAENLLLIRASRQKGGNRTIPIVSRELRLMLRFENAVSTPQKEELLCGQRYCQ